MAFQGATTVIDCRICRIFQEAKAAVGEHRVKSRLARFTQGLDDQTKLIESMAKLNRIIGLLQVFILPL